VVSTAVSEHGGSVTGVVPYAMVVGGGEGPPQPADSEAKGVDLAEESQGNRKVVIVHSMHERKVEMAKRVGSFIGLPGGFGTFEEVMEVTTWTQLNIHCKPVILLNVRNFFSPLRDLIHTAIESGFIPKTNVGLITFVDGPSDISQHDSFDWGAKAIEAIEEWKPPSWSGYGFKWTKDPAVGEGEEGNLAST